MKITFSTVLNVLIVLLIGFYIGRYFYFQPKFINGERAPDFTAQLIDGSSFRLEELRGQFVLIDFWGSWCGPCRKENPELVRFYEHYKDREIQDDTGLEIVSIAIETGEAAWRRAIEKDGLDWPYHIVQLDRFQSPLPQQFGVRSIPTKYLLNPQGYIIAVNPSFRELEKLLEKEQG